VSLKANRTVTRFFDRCGVARSLFVWVEKAGCALRAGLRRADALVDDVAPVLPDVCGADPPDGADGDEGAVVRRVGVVVMGGVTGLGADGVVTRVVVVVVTVTGGVLTVTGGAGGGAGAGGSAVVTGSGGGGGAGGSAVVTGSGGGGGTAVVTGTDGIVTVTPGTGGTSRASACAATRPAMATPSPQRLPKRDIRKYNVRVPLLGAGGVRVESYLRRRALVVRDRVGSRYGIVRMVVAVLVVV
jgi:hypothetical protein